MFKIFVSLILICFSTFSYAYSGEALDRTINNAITIGPNYKSIFASPILVINKSDVESGYTENNITTINIKSIPFPAYFKCKDYIEVGKRYDVFWTSHGKKIDEEKALEICRDKEILEVNIPLN